jgi:hypothetical protein
MTTDKNNELTRVTFRKDKKGDFKGTVTAVFYNDKESNGLMGCYAHIGQHRSCSIYTILLTQLNKNTKT